MAYQPEQAQGSSPPVGTTVAGGSVSELQQLIEMLRGTLDGASEMIAVEDPTAHYLAFNRAYHAEFKRIFGIDLAIGACMFDLLAHLPEERKAATELFERTMRGEDFTVIHAFGDERLARRYYELHCYPLHDHAGRVIAGTHIARDVTRDITERKRAEEAELRFRIALDSAADNIFLIDPQAMRYLDVSQSACRDLGYSREELLRLGPPQIMPQLSDEELRRRFAEIRADPPAKGAIETVHYRKDGTGFAVEVILRPVEIQGRQLLVAVARDITERKRAEEALRQSEERLKLAQQAGHLGVFDWDMENDNAVISGDLETIFGVSPGGVDRVTYEKWREFVHPDDLPRIIQEFQQCLQERRPQAEYAYHIIRPDGQVRCVEVKGQTSYLENGMPARMVGTVVDITERKAAEDALRESEGKFRALAENAHASFGIVQGQRFVYANPWFAQISGYSVEELLTMDFPALVHPDFKPMMEERARRRQQGEPVPNHYEFAMLTKSGEKRWVEFSVATFEYRGKPAIIGTGFDITERKRAEEGLRLRNERLALLSEAAAHLLKAENPDTMILELFEKVSRLLNIQGYMNFMINEAGDALRLDSSAGVPEEATRKVRRLEFGQGVCGTVAQCGQPIYAHCIQESDAEMVQLLKDLGIRAYACNPLIAGGRLLGTLAFATNTRDAYSEDDLSFMRTICQYVAMAKERLRLESELRSHIEQLAEANSALAEADRRKNEFLAMLAHELRNPLAPIRNAIQVLRMIDLHEPAQKRQGDIIDRQITHMARLLNDLLDVSRITRGKIELNRQPLALGDVLNHAVETARPLIEARHHILTIAAPPPNLRVLADLDRLAQVVGNLLTNAAKYTEEGGRIWLEAGREGDEAVIRVRDTGVGIAPDLLPHIFELFTQADHSLARTQGGLGIGLTMVHRLVEMHGGSVEARSAGLGQGSEFTIRLPALVDEGWTEVFRPEPPLVMAASGMPPRRVLVVDDIIDTAESLAELLGIWGHQVHVAHNGSGALEAAHAFKPEVVLLDIGLPDMSGFEVARHLRVEHGRGVLLIALTGYGQYQDREATRNSGFDYHLVKPVDLAVLREMLARLEHGQAA